MVPEGSAAPSLGTKVENPPQTVRKPPPPPHLVRLARGGRAKELSGQPS